MTLLPRHIGIHVLSAVILVMVVLAGLFGIAEFADELTDAPKGAGTLDVMAYVIWRMPGILLDNLGFSMLLGCLIGLGVLANQSEITVMRASGVSILGVVWMVLRPMLALMLVAAALGEYVIPGMNRHAEQRLMEAGQEEGQATHAFASGGGLWLRHDDDFLHFNAIHPNGKILGLSWLHFNDARALDGVGYAPQAVFNQGNWSLQSANITLLGEQRVQAAVGQKDIGWDSSLAPDLLSLVVSEPENMSMQDLSSYIGYLDKQLQDRRPFALAFWQKALRPFAMIGMVLIAISFIFGPLRSTTMGYRLFTGIMVGVAFRFAQDMLGPVSLVFGLSPVLAVGMPIVVSWALGLTLLSRVR
jgi:lipopolysaccharide export system permease protein